MEKATLHDYARMCKFYDDCKECPLENYRSETFITCDYLVRTVTDKANEIILNWCKEHPIKTRQDEFLKMFPSAALVGEAVNICPREIDNQCSADCTKLNCYDCKKSYWLAEVYE